MVNASQDKHFDLMRSENFTLGTCDGNSNYCDFFNHCVYHDILSLNNLIKLKGDDLFILHFNVRSLQNNVDKLITFLATFSETPNTMQYQKLNLHFINH